MSGNGSGIGSGIVMDVVGGSVVVVVVVGWVVVVVVSGVVVEVVGGGCSVVLVEAGGGVRVVVVVTGSGFVGETGREVVVVEVAASVVGPRSVGVDVGAAVALAGVSRLASNLPVNDEFTETAPGFTVVLATVDLSGAETGGVVVVDGAIAGAVFGAAVLLVADEVRALSDERESFWTNPT